MSTDGDARLLQGADNLLDHSARVAACFADHLDPAHCEHSVQDLVAQRLDGLALGYEDLNDHDNLHDDLLLALALGCHDVTGVSCARERDRGHPPPASSRLNWLALGWPEQVAGDRYKRILADPQQLDRSLVELFLDQQRSEPEQLVLPS